MTASERVNILMVDDQPAKLLTYEAILADLGENLIKATSAREALDILLHTDIAVILMDVSMPDLDGFELADLIRQHPRFEKTAIIFISGVHLSEADTINGYKRGAVDYISVPVVPEVLRAKIGVFAELRRKTKLLERLNNELERRVEERTEELKSSEVQFRTLANSIPQLAWMANADGSAFWYNQRWCDFSDLSMEDLQEKGWSHLRHPDHAGRIEAGLRQALQAGQSWEDTFPIRSGNGDYCWFLWRAVPIRNYQGEVQRWFGTATDIGTQIAAEEKIRSLNTQLEQRVTELEAIMQVLPAGVAISDRAFSSVTTNPGFRDIFDAASTRLAGDVGGAVERAALNGGPFVIMDRTVRTGRPVIDAELQVASHNGERKHVLASASPLLELSGRVRGSVGVFFDISHRKNLEHTSRERAELLDLASEAICVHEMTGNIRYWNSGAEALYGWDRKDALGCGIHSLLQTVFPMSHEEVDRTLIEEGSWRGNLTQRSKDGREIVVASRMSLDRETNVVLEINRDITGELRAEEALRQTEKLAAMGRMAGIIAHEINNPLEAITNVFYLLRNHPSLDNEARAYADMAEEELERASHITRQTLSFYRESKQPISVALPEVLDSVLELQHRNIQTAGIAVERRYHSEGMVCGFPVELRQMFLNLIGNAVQAMTEGGILRIRVAEAPDNLTGRHGVFISITDTGVGIRDEDARKLFQPFFSTKSTKGTGLGLWISKGIVQKYDGRLTFKSIKYRGQNVTNFRVFLPAETAPSPVRPETISMATAAEVVTAVK